MFHVSDEDLSIITQDTYFLMRLSGHGVRDTAISVMGGGHTIEGLIEQYCGGDQSALSSGLILVSFLTSLTFWVVVTMVLRVLE